MAIGFGASKKDIDNNSRRLKRNERRANRIASRKNKNAIKQNVSDGLGILQIVMIIVLIITITRVLSGTIEGNYPFSQFFNELITFEGVDLQLFISNLSPLEIIFGEDLPNWVQVIGNAIGKVVNPLGMILGCLINATWFILHILGVLFGF